MRSASVVAALALALATPAEAGGEDGRSSKVSPQQGGTAAQQGSREGAPTGTQRDAPGMLPDVVEQDPSGEAQAPTETVVGTVVKKEAGKLTVKSTDLGDPHVIALGEETRLLHEGQSIGRDEVLEGDLIRATLTGAEGAARATEITVIERRTESRQPSGPGPQRGQPADTPAADPPATREPADGPAGTGTR